MATQNIGEVSPAGEDAKEIFMKAFEEMMAPGAAWRAGEVSPEAMDSRTPIVKTGEKLAAPLTSHALASHRWKITCRDMWAAGTQENVLSAYYLWTIYWAGLWSFFLQTYATVLTHWLK